MKIIIDYVKKKPFTSFVRFFFLFSVISFVIVCYNSFCLVIDFIHFVFCIIVYSPCAIICNAGLYFITTELSKNYRILSTILYLPSIFISPFFTGRVLDTMLIMLIFPNYTYDGYLSIIAVFILSLYIYYHFNPWRKTKNDL